MKNTDEQFEQADDLRRLVKTMAWEETARSPEEMRGILHELRMHQFELEMQNDELRRTQVELNSARMRYVELYDGVPVGYTARSTGRA
jgi:hypothetical protein